jgi:hypothetical protein
MAPVRPIALALLLLAPTAGAWADEDPGPEEEEPSDEERELDDVEPVPHHRNTEGPYRHRTAPFAALNASACLPVSELQLGAHGSLTAGVQLPWFEGRLLPGLELGAARVSDAGRIEDERLPDGEAYAWELGLRQLELGGGLRVRVFPGDARISPELELAAHAVRVHSVLHGSIGADATRPVHELSWRPGWRGAAGLAAELGPGWLLLQLGYRGLGLEGVIAGQSRIDSLLAGVGYRGSL